MIVFFFSVLGCGKLIINVWNKWDQSPVIVSFAEKSTPIWEIPFPAVTICPETKAKQSVFNFTEAYHNMLDANQMLTNLTDEDRVRMEAVAQICEAHLTAALHLGNKTTGPDIVKTLRDVINCIARVYISFMLNGRENTYFTELIFFLHFRLLAI